MPARRNKKVLQDLEIGFLSGVDVPAQEGAVVAAIKNSTGAPVMPNTKTAEQYDAEMADLNAQLERYKSLAEMSDAQKAFMKSLDPDDRPTFIKKSFKDREAAIKDAFDADPVYYVSKRQDRSFRTSERALADMAKRLDEAEDEKEEIAKAAKAERIAKRVSDLGHLSNDQDGLTLIVEMVDSIKDPAKKKAANAVLDGANVSAKEEQATSGVKKGGQLSGDVAATKKAYKDYIKKYAADHDISEAEATLKVATDPTAKRLQKAWREAQNAANA